MQAARGREQQLLYYEPRPQSADELDVLDRLDRIFTDHPVYGSRLPQVALLREGISVGRRCIRRLMRKLELCAVRPAGNVSFARVDAGCCRARSAHPPLSRRNTSNPPSIRRKCPTVSA